eukprot:XP_014035606.1 PREDICTED: DNA primase large subunit-like [Salmo salar]
MAENLGVSDVKTSQQYTKKLDAEFSNLNFPNKIEAMSVEEKNLMDKLINSSFAVSTFTLEDQDFYKVPFQDALDLVRTRKVYLKGGYVYIPHKDIVTIGLNDF